MCPSYLLGAASLLTQLSHQLMQLGNGRLVELANARLDQGRQRADGPAAVASGHSVDDPDHRNPGMSRQRERCEPLPGAGNARDRISGCEQVRRKQAERQAGRDETGECDLTVPAKSGAAGMGCQRLESKRWRGESKWGWLADHARNLGIP